MITPSDNIDVIRSDPNSTEHEHEFTIKVSAKAFAILSSGIYSDKIGSIIRELSTNAYDAHKEAGNLQTPFIIHAPSYFDPTFKLRDYGTGINPDKILEIYTTYFESSKNESNEYVGCMGLGSKTPLCYTDSFTVINYYNGVKYYYIIFLNERGFPSIRRINDIKTDEPNGLEISFGVSVDDCSKFVMKIEESFGWYDIQPTIINNDYINFKRPEYILKNEKWGIRIQKPYEDCIKYAVMGNIGYPINMHSVEDLLTSDAKLLLSSLSIDIFFDIGDFEVTTSRESISYTIETTQKISERLQNIANEIEDMAEEKLSGCDNPWDAVAIYDLFFANLNIGGNSSYRNNIPIKWKDDIISKPYIHVGDILSFAKKGTPVEVSYYCVQKDKAAISNQHSFIYPSKKHIFLLCDSKYAINKKLSKIALDNDYDSCYAIVIHNYKKDPGSWNIIKKRLLGNNTKINIYKSSEIKIERTKRSDTLKRNFKNIYIYDYMSQGFVSYSGDIKDDISGCFIHPSRISNKYLRKMSLEVNVMKRLYKIFTDRELPDVFIFTGRGNIPSNLIEYDVHTRAEIKDSPLFNTCMAYIRYALGHYSLRYNILHVLIYNYEEIKNIEKHFEGIDILNKDAIIKPVDEDFRLLNGLFSDDERGEYDKIIENIHEIANKCFPIYRHSMYNYSKDTKKDFIEYFNMCLERKEENEKNI